MPASTLLASWPLARPAANERATKPISRRRRRVLTAAAAAAVVAVVAIALHATGALGLYTSVTKDEIVKPPNWAQLDGTSKNIKGQILAYVGLFLGPLLIFAGACVIIGARLGNEMMGKIAGGLVFIVAVAPAILA